MEGKDQERETGKKKDKEGGSSHIEPKYMEE